MELIRKRILKIFNIFKKSLYLIDKSIVVNALKKVQDLKKKKIPTQKDPKDGELSIPPS